MQVVDRGRLPQGRGQRPRLTARRGSSAARRRAAAWGRVPRRRAAERPAASNSASRLARRPNEPPRSRAKASMAGPSGMNRSAETASSHSSAYCCDARYLRSPSINTNTAMIHHGMTIITSRLREVAQQPDGDQHPTDDRESEIDRVVAQPIAPPGDQSLRHQHGDPQQHRRQRSRQRAQFDWPCSAIQCFNHRYRDDLFARINSASTFLNQGNQRQTSWRRQTSRRKRRSPET